MAKRRRPPRGGKRKSHKSNDNRNQKRSQKKSGPSSHRGRRSGDSSPPQSTRRSIERAIATVDKNRRGFAFLIFDRKDLDDVMVPRRDAVNLFHGDRISVSITQNDEVVGFKVVEHRFKELVGKYSPTVRPHRGKKGGGYVIYERKHTQEQIFIPDIPKNINEGDWVQVELDFNERGPHPVTGVIKTVFGESIPASADIDIIAAEYNLVEEHSKKSVEEAKSCSLDLDSELENRQDLRDVPFITIDGETARDFDDAVYVEKKGKSHTLWVAIADVTHYVKPGTQLDQEARSRATSVYFPERAFHMLPRELSENLCSLRPDEPRMSLVAKMEFDQNGKNTNTEIMNAVIQSHRRATYTEIFAEYNHSKDKKEDWKFNPHFELYQILRKARRDRGSIDFEIPESIIVATPEGEVESISKASRNDAHRLIEEFMIAANEAVTRWMIEKLEPFIYRIHEEPSVEALTKFQGLAKMAGVDIQITDFKSPKAIADVVRQVSGHEAETLLNFQLLRAMKQAIYSSDHGIHFGLASEAYTHFTSPIRRYPDLIVHRLIKKVISEIEKTSRKKSSQEKDDIHSELTDIVQHCSYRERLAAEAERESKKLKAVRFMRERLGEEFDGMIIGVNERGLFTQLDDPYVEGLIPKDSLIDDFYEFNESRMQYVGSRTRNTYKVGQRVKVQLARVNFEERLIDFALMKA